MLNLHLGCGNKIYKNFINVDKNIPENLTEEQSKYFVKHDLEIFPWPFETNSISTVQATHILEHLGKEFNTYLNILKEIYRICTHNAEIKITVPHPRHSWFINDPTHVRIITPEGLELFSKKSNKEWIKQGYSNSTFGLDFDIDFELVNYSEDLDPTWEFKQRFLSKDDLIFAKSSYNNVICQYNIILKVIKE